MTSDDQAVDTGLDLAEGERLLAAMTEGLWVAVGEHIDQYAPHPDGNRLLSGGSSYDDYSTLTASDTAAIAWLRNNGSALVAALKAAQQDAADHELNLEHWAYHTSQCHAEMEQLRDDLKAANEVLADKRRVVRELDVLLNGEDGAAKQASLIDLFPQIEKLRARIARVEAERDYQAETANGLHQAVLMGSKQQRQLQAGTVALSKVYDLALEHNERLQARIAELETAWDGGFEAGGKAAVADNTYFTVKLEQRIAELEGSLREMLDIVYSGANDERGHLFSETQLAIKRAEDALEKATPKTAQPS